MPEINFGPNTKASDVTPYSLGVLQDVMGVANIAKLTISSTRRYPPDQARVMFDNLETHGVAAQRQLYKPAGQAVIDVYVAGKAAGKTAVQIKADMTAKVIEVGPVNVSHHASDPNVLNVFDIAPTSVSNEAAFETAVNADARISKFLKPPRDPGLHLEIPQPQTTG
jgi:hypothetical protein